LAGDASNQGSAIFVHFNTFIKYTK
jgi:hypothetical protein